MTQFLRRIAGALTQYGLENVADLGGQLAARATSRQHRQHFKVQLPLTVFVRGSYCEVTVRYGNPTHVELDAQLRAAFGWELATDQDDAGVYIVARRKLVTGTLSTARLNLTVPPQANLVFHLTPGSVHMLDYNGKLALPALESPPL